MVQYNTPSAVLQQQQHTRARSYMLRSIAAPRCSCYAEPLDHIRQRMPTLDGGGAGGSAISKEAGKAPW